MSWYCAFLTKINIYYRSDFRCRLIYLFPTLKLYFILIAFLTDMSIISHLLFFIRYEDNFPEHNFKKICIRIREENFRPIITLICCQNFLNMKIAWNNLRLIKVRYIWIIFRKLINITQGCWENMYSCFIAR